MTESQKIHLQDLKARLLNGARLPCPRCGRDVMDAKVLRNACSRHTDVYICDACGMDEAFLDMRHSPKPMAEWACFATAQVSEQLTTRELISRVMTEHIRYLSTLYARWLDEHEYEDFKAYQAAAKENCPNLSELQSDPFCAVFLGNDGKLVVRFESDGTSITASAEVIPLAE